MTPMPSGETLRVLVVEDEPRLQQLLVDQIPRMGFAAHGARTAEQAVRHLEESPVHVALLDLNLPGVSGLELLEIIARRWPDISVVIMTGFGDLEAAKKAIHYGVVEFLTKPAHLGEIERALQKAWDRTRAKQEGTAPPPEEESAPRTIADAEKQLILEALDRHHGNRTAAADELGISRRTLYNKLVQYGYQPESEE